MFASTLHIYVLLFAYSITTSSTLNPTLNLVYLQTDGYYQSDIISLLTLPYAYDQFTDPVTNQSLFALEASIKLSNLSDGDQAIRNVVETVRSDVDVFFGPRTNCFHTSAIATAYSKFVITPDCYDSRVDDAQGKLNLVRFHGSDKQIADNLMLLMNHYEWKKFTLLYDKLKYESSKSYSVFVDSVRTSMVHVSSTVDVVGCNMIGGLIYLATPDADCASAILQTYLHTRVYIVLTPPADRYSLLEMRLLFEHFGISQTGEYVIVIVPAPFLLNRMKTLNELHDWDLYIYAQYFTASADRYRQTGMEYFLTVDYRSPNGYERLRNFILFHPRTVDINVDKIKKVIYTYIETVLDDKPCPMFCDPAVARQLDKFAASARLFDQTVTTYDALRVLFTLFLESQARNTTLNGNNYAEYFRNYKFKSLRGYDMTINENLMVNENYSLFSYNIDKGHFASIGNTLELNSSMFIEFFKNMSWINGVPTDEPRCNFMGTSMSCINKIDYVMIVVWVSCGFVFILLVVALGFTHRYYKYERELMKLLWKIDLREISIQQQLNRLASIRSFGSDMLSAIESTSSLRMMQTSNAINDKAYRNDAWIREHNDGLTTINIAVYKGAVVVAKRVYKPAISLDRDNLKQLKLLKDIKHDNLNAFLGVVVEPPVIMIVLEQATRGNLNEVLENDEINLDQMFLASIVFDIIRGLEYIHNSSVTCHGRLKSPNCLVDSRWTIKLTDFGLTNILRGESKPLMFDQAAKGQLWTAPEILREQYCVPTQEGDIYSLGIVLHEIFSRREAFGYDFLDPNEAIEKIKFPSLSEIYRPNLKVVDHCDDYLVDVMQQCWSEAIVDRPSLLGVKRYLKPLQTGLKSNIFDNMLAMMEKYSNNLEEIVAERTQQLNEERQKSERLLLQILPKSVADQLKMGKPVPAESFPDTSIYFSDIVGFTNMSSNSTPFERLCELNLANHFFSVIKVVAFLNDLYTCFDAIVENYDVYKVETIGDAYMVVSGVPIRNGDNHAGEIASMSLSLLETIKTFKIRHRPADKLMLRIGIHSGSCVAGVVGLKMPRYCLFGDTVNTASRMESNGEALKIHCSDDCQKLLAKIGGYNIVERGYIAMKGKGEQLTHWVVSEDQVHRCKRIEEESKKFPSLKKAV